MSGNPHEQLYEDMTNEIFDLLERAEGLGKLPEHKRETIHSSSSNFYHYVFDLDGSSYYSHLDIATQQPFDEFPFTEVQFMDAYYEENRSSPSSRRTSHIYALREKMFHIGGTSHNNLFYFSDVIVAQGGLEVHTDATYDLSQEITGLSVEIANPHGNPYRYFSKLEVAQNQVKLVEYSYEDDNEDYQTITETVNSALYLDYVVRADTNPQQNDLSIKVISRVVGNKCYDLRIPLKCKQPLQEVKDLLSQVKL